MYFIGIDGGLNGGLTVIDEAENILQSIVMPIFDSKRKEYDLSSIQKFFEYYNMRGAVICGLEQAHTKPLNGVKQNFTIGRCFGQMEGLLTSMKIKYEVILARRWQKEIFQGIVADDTKLASMKFCSRKYPNHTFTRTERSKKMHDGMTDSCCIAVYLKRLYYK